MSIRTVTQQVAACPLQLKSNPSDTAFADNPGREPMPKFLARLLETEIDKRDDTDLVFVATRRYLTLGEVRWVFDSAAEAVGVGDLRPHDLRHTCASLAISAGANIKVLQTLLGHKTATLTLDRYGHLFPDDLSQIADAFDAATRTTADQLRTIGTLRAKPSD